MATERLTLAEKARRRDGDGKHLSPPPGIFWRGRILTDGTELWLAVVHPAVAFARP